MEVAEILECIAKEQEKISLAQSNTNTYLALLATKTKEDWDWVPVKQGAAHLGVSMPVIYAKINSGELSVRHINSKKLVRLSELERINDGCGI